MPRSRGAGGIPGGNFGLRLKGLSWPDFVRPWHQASSELRRRIMPWKCTGWCTSTKLAVVALLVAALLCSCRETAGPSAIPLSDVEDGGGADNGTALTAQPAVPWETMPRKWQQVRGTCRFHVVPIPDEPGTWNIQFWTIDAPQDVTTIQADEARIPAILANVAWRHPAKLGDPSAGTLRTARTSWIPWPDDEVFAAQNGDAEFGWTKWSGDASRTVGGTDKQSELWVLKRENRGSVWIEISSGNLSEIRTNLDSVVTLGVGKTVMVPITLYSESLVPIEPE